MTDARAKQVVEQAILDDDTLAASIAGRPEDRLNPHQIALLHIFANGITDALVDVTSTTNHEASPAPVIPIPRTPDRFWPAAC